MAKKVTLDELVAAVHSADKPLTETEIGEVVGVTRPTVANYRDELQSHPEIAYGDVGGSRAYWADEKPSDPQDFPPDLTSRDRSRETSREETDSGSSTLRERIIGRWNKHLRQELQNPARLVLGTGFASVLGAILFVLSIHWQSSLSVFPALLGGTLLSLAVPAFAAAFFRLMQFTAARESYLDAQERTDETPHGEAP
jgi:hypothetical protein